MSRFTLTRFLHALSVVACLLLLFVTSGPTLKAGVSRGSTVGVRAAPFNPYGASNDKGMINFRADNDAETLHTRLRTAGVGWVRYWLSWEVAEGSPRNYTWTVPDQDINAALDQGLNVYITIQGAPAWVNNGSPTYHWGQCSAAGTGAVDLTQPGCGPAGAGNAYAPFDPGDPSVDPGDPTPNKGQSYYWKRFVTAAVKHYGDRVKYWGFWNEPSTHWFWPEWEAAPCNNRAGQLINKVIKPARDAALAANPSVVIVGPDETLIDQSVTPSTAPFLAGLLSIERDGLPGCYQPSGLLWDIISFHAYMAPVGPGVTPTLDALKHTLDNYDRREVWITETDADGYIIEGATELSKRGWISKIFAHAMKGQSCSEKALFDVSLNACPSLTTYQNFIQTHQPAMHFAGATGVSGHNDFLLLQNPHAQATTALVTFAPPGGAGAFVRSYSLPATSRTTLYVPTEGFSGMDQSVSVVPSVASLPIWAEHADYWNNQEAGRATEGAYEHSDTWYFAEGAIGSGWWTEYVTAYNPSPDNSVNVSWQFLNQSGGNPAPLTYTIPPRGQYKVWVNGVAGVEGVHSTKLSGVWLDGDHAGQPAPIVGDRTMSWNGEIDGHEGKGVPYPSTSWYFAEGSSGSWTTYLCMMNPTNRPATVTGYYMVDGSGLAGPYTYTIPAMSRFTVTPIFGSPFGVNLQSNVPIVAERSMYLGADWTVGTIGEGATSPMQRWMFAEGSSAGYYTYYLLANPTSVAATVNASFQIEGVGVYSFPVTVPAGQRYTIDPSGYPALQNRSYSLELTVQNTPDTVPASIVAERAMYWLGGSPFKGGHVSLGMP